MEFADFAVEIEETLAKVTTEYECTMLDEDEIGLGWHFLFEDSIDGFLICEKEDELFGFPTVTIALRIADLTGMPSFLIKSLFELNMAFINVSLSLVQMPGVDSDEAENAEDNDFDDEEVKEQDELALTDNLVMRMKIPYEQFQPTDFEDYLQTLISQSDVVFDFLDSLSEDEDEEE